MAVNNNYIPIELNILIWIKKCWYNKSGYILFFFFCSERNAKALLSVIHVVPRKKGRDLTQSYDKNITPTENAEKPECHYSNTVDINGPLESRDETKCHSSDYLLFY